MATSRNRWRIVYEDEYLIAVDKPANYLSIPDRYDNTVPNLLESLKQYRSDIYVNHRLDKNTSGLILFTKSEESHKQFSALFERREIEKLYYALVLGVPSEEVGLVDMPLSLSKAKSKIMKPDPGGKESKTKFRLLRSWGTYSFLELKLITGRMHQIRAHMNYIYTPLICDELYGDGRPLFLSDFKRSYRPSSSKPEKALLERQALHAHSIRFIHPLLNEELQLESELPKDMKAAINQFDKNLEIKYPV